MSCHGTNLPGTSAPSVAGDDFLSAAQQSSWSVEDLRSIVAYNMPFNAPGSLSGEQTANVIAYMLAANCYPAGNEPFPEQDKAALGDIKLRKPEHAQPSNKQLGTCTVR